MISAIIYCHHHGVVHRDIKLDNFIYESEEEDAELKLIDFGFAAEVRNVPADDCDGTATTALAQMTAAPRARAMSPSRLPWPYVPLARGDVKRWFGHDCTVPTAMP